MKSDRFTTKLNDTIWDLLSTHIYATLQRTYTVSQKHAILHSFITLTNVGRFQTFFCCWTQQEICNIVGI